MITLRVAVAVPDFIGRGCEAILQIYSRIRYGSDTRLISLGLGKFAIVDADDYPRLSKHTWDIKLAWRHSYAARFTAKPGKSNHTKISMHREVLESPKGMCVDHINGNGLDNRKSNLRPATMMQNNWNRRKRRGYSTSRFKGVSRAKKACKWRAQIKCDGKDKYLGVFDEEEAAARVYDANARKLFGKYARLNFPDDGSRFAASRPQKSRKYRWFNCCQAIIMRKIRKKSWKNEPTALK